MTAHQDPLGHSRWKRSAERWTEPRRALLSSVWADTKAAMHPGTAVQEGLALRAPSRHTVTTYGVGRFQGHIGVTREKFLLMLATRSRCERCPTARNLALGSAA